MNNNSNGYDPSSELSAKAGSLLHLVLAGAFVIAGLIDKKNEKKRINKK